MTIEGKNFGAMTALRLHSLVPRPSGGHSQKWECLCDCGNVVVRFRAVLTRGESCGCRRSSGKSIDISGRRFNKITAVRLHSRVPKKNGGHDERWECACDCGRTVLMLKGSIKKSYSCGCETVALIKVKKSRSRSKHKRLYSIWSNIKNRCTNSMDAAYRNYGGRGIKMCEAWAAYGDAGFAQFAKDVGEPPTAAHTLDRINNDGNYEPGNVRWADRKTQNRNRRDTLCVVVNGERFKVADLADFLGISRQTLVSRINHGWTGEKLLSTPRPCGR
jgi:hypothetical protein